MTRIIPGQIALRQSLNKLYIDLIVDLTVNAGNLDQYEEADRTGFLSEVNQELQAVDAMTATQVPTTQQISNKDSLVSDIGKTIISSVVPPGPTPQSQEFDIFPL